MLRLSSSFWRDRRGVVAQLAVLSISVVIGSAGLAIDGAAFWHAQARLQATADAVVLATAKQVLDNGLSPAEAQAYAANYVKSLLPQGSVAVDPNDQSAQVSQLTIPPLALMEQSTHIDQTRRRVSLVLTGQAKTFLMQILGVSTTTITVRSAAEPPPQNLDIVLVVDNSGWVNAPSPNRLSWLQSSLHLFTSLILDGADENVSQRRIAIVPFATGINPGSYAKLIAGGAPLDPAGPGGRQCLFERLPLNGGPNPDQITDMLPVGSDALSNPSSLPKTTTASNAAPVCPAAPILPLTGSAGRSNIDQAIDAMTAPAGTSKLASGHLGLAWAYYMLSEKWGANIWPSAVLPKSVPINRRVVIFITASPLSTFMGGGSPSQPHPIALDAANGVCSQGLQPGETQIFTIVLTPAAWPTRQTIMPDASASPNDTYATLTSCSTRTTDRGTFTTIEAAYDRDDIDAAIQHVASSLLSVSLVGY